MWLFVVYKGSRLAWAPTILATIGLVHLQTISPIFRIKSIGVRTIGAVIISLCTIINLISAIVYQRELTAIHNEFYEKYAASTDGVVRYDIPHYDFDLTLGKTSVLEYIDGWAARCSKYYYGKPDFVIISNSAIPNRPWTALYEDTDSAQ
jgi:hypothetical protein